MLVTITPNQVRRWLIVITTGLLIAHITTQIGIYGFGAHKYWLDSLNMDREVNLPTFFSTVLLMANAIALRRLSVAPNDKNSPHWKRLSQIFLFLAADEALQIHEILIIPGLRRQIHPALASTWVIPYALLALGLLWHFRHFLKNLPQQTSNRFLRSGGIYIMGAIGMEMVGSFAVRSGLIRLHSFWYGTITGMEESLEILGLIFFLHALMLELLTRSNHLTWTLKLKSNSP